MSIFAGIVFIVFVISTILFNIECKEIENYNIGVFGGIVGSVSLLSGLFVLLCIGHYIAVLLA